MWWNTLYINGGAISYQFMRVLDPPIRRPNHPKMENKHKLFSFFIWCPNLLGGVRRLVQFPNFFHRLNLKASLLNVAFLFCVPIISPRNTQNEKKQWEEHAEGLCLYVELDFHISGLEKIFGWIYMYLVCAGVLSDSSTSRQSSAEEAKKNNVHSCRPLTYSYWT